MPKTKRQENKKTLKQKIKKPKVKKLKINREKISVDLVRIHLLRQELNYFKGLSIMMTALILCVFVAFGILFSAMYMETRATRVIFQHAFSDFFPAPVASVDTAADLEEDELLELEEIAEYEAEGCCGVVEEEEVEWLSFEKYGFRAYFPNSWPLLDKPFEKTPEVHFYTDRTIREQGDADIGDFVIAQVKTDNYKEDYAGKLLQVNGVIGITYTIGEAEGTYQVVMVPAGENYLELRFNQVQTGEDKISDDLIREILDKFEVIE
ncbi:hypothetical protein HQ571_05145 [Candidatus Kuenenbacteria bacterium]|nr:hypothetical protein [Candidatus Kuenenbacteria bacterium]